MPAEHIQPLEKMKPALVVDAGLIEFEAAWLLQKRLVAARKAGAISDVLVLCEHPHVITLGRNGKIANLLASASVLRQMGVTYFEIDRGGDITYHGPGQLVVYPILDLTAIKRDVAWYMRTLEEAMILVSADLGISAGRIPGRTGVWVEVTENGTANEEKLGAIGVHLSRWVTSHGLAYNVSTDLRYFDLIVPCGIAEKRATSVEKLLGRTVAMQGVADGITRELGELLGLHLSIANLRDAEELLEAYERQAVATSA